MAIAVEIANFHQPRVFNAPAKGFSLEFCNGSGAKNQNDAPARMSKKCDDMSIPLDTVLYWTDGRTDGRNWQNNISLCMHSKFTCDKKTDQLNKLITVKRTKSSLMGGVIGRSEWAWLGDRWAGLWAGRL